MKFAVSLAAAILMFTTTIGIALAISPIQGFLPIRSIGTAGDPSTGMAAGDIDDDGDIDLVIANDGTQNRIYRNNGNGSFQEEDISLTTLKTRDIHLVDMDNDGDLDIITAEGSATGHVSSLIYLNDGNGHFGSTGTVIAFESRTAPSYAKSIAAGDLNGDGKMDVAIAYYGKNRVCIQGSSPASWTCDDLSDDEYHTAAIAMADIDHDGQPDIITGNADNHNFVYFNNGPSSQPTRKAFGSYTDATYGLAIGDLNRNGRLDIVVANYNQINRSYRFSSRTGYLTSNFGDFTHKTYGISVGDIDKDGDLDVFIANDRQINLLMKNDGSGFFHNSDAFSINDTGKSHQLVMADFNRDGKRDLACANWLGTNSLLLHKGSMLPLLLVPVIAGSHEAPQPVTSPAAPSQVTATAEDDTFAITLHWHDNSNNENAFVFYRSETENFYDAVGIGTGAPNLTHFQDRNLEACKTYYYWVAAKNTAGETVSANYVTAMTAPEAPADLYSTNYIIRSTTLYWQNNNDQCTVRYHLYAKAPGDNSYTQIPDGNDLTDGSSGSININITPESYIYYRVAAENSDGTIGPMSCTVKSGYRSAYAHTHAGCNAAVGYAFGDKPKYPWASTDKSNKVIFTWDDVPLQYNSNGSAVSMYANCFRVAYRIGSGGWVNYTDCLQNPTIQNNWQYQSFEINNMTADTSATIQISTHYLYDTDRDGNYENVYSDPITITGKTLPSGSGGGGVAALGTPPWVTASHYFPGKIMVGWTTSNDATSYQMYRGSWNGACSGANYSSYRTFSASQSSFDDMVGDWQQFCYKVRACNNGVCTAFSSGEYGNSGGL